MESSWRGVLDAIERVWGKRKRMQVLGRYIGLRHAYFDRIFHTPVAPKYRSADVASVFEVAASVEASAAAGTTFAAAAAAGNVTATAGNTAAVAGSSIVVAAAAVGNGVVADNSILTVDGLYRPAYHDLHGDRCYCDLRYRPALQSHGLLDLRRCSGLHDLFTSLVECKVMNHEFDASVRATHPLKQL